MRQETPMFKSSLSTAVPAGLAVKEMWIRAGIGAGTAALAGLASVVWMPHGPATAMQALFVLASGLIIGLFAGLCMRSRWAGLLAPLAYVAAVELAHLGATQPTVGPIRLDNAYGILAFFLGRGFHGMVGILPMVYGAALAGRLIEAGALRRAAGRPALPVQWWLSVILPGMIIAALAVWIALPASTPPILDANGDPVPGSIAELTTVRIGGQDQGLMIRGYSVDKPVLLYLSGGPGQSSLPYPRVIFEDISQDFIVVGWDQRGTGKSYAALDPVSDLTLEQMVTDTIEVTQYLRQRFDADKIYLLGESWGTTLGVLAAQRAPELYYGFIGSGQMVSQRETDRRLYYDVLALAERNGDTHLAETMRAYGEPPYADLPYGNAFVMGYYEQLSRPYTPPQAYIQRGQAANLGPFGVFGSEYNLVEKVNVLRGLEDMFTVLYPQIQGIDFRRDVPRLDVPVYILDGEAELSARRDLALEWYGQLEAPVKHLYSFENAGHSVAFEQYAAFHKILVEDVLPETYPAQ
ncbi:MAG: alpha/beta fold hydrolase [Chloroflexi bacterium]|nr:alpha/beta fold hydrolase [Chloroflexota bacterium]